MMRNHPQKLVIASAQYSKEKEYWVNKLSGELEKSSFPYDYKQNGDQCKIETLQFRISGKLFSRLMKLRNESDIRLHMILVSGLALLLNKYTGQEDIILGAPTLNQNIDVEFINTVLVLRNSIDSNLVFKELLLQVRQTIVEATENQNYPIETLLYHLDMIFSEKEFPLFDIAILLENIHTNQYLKHIYTNMMFIFSRKDEYLDGVIEYNSFRYKKDTIKQINAHFKNLLEKALFDVNLKLYDIDILSEEEKTKLLFDFNRTEADYPKDKTIHQLFEKQVEKVTDKVVVVYGDEQLTYGELNKRANRLAMGLRARGVKADDTIGIMVDRSVELIIGIMGILKAGGAYLPIEPDSPQNRITAMLDDCNASLLLTRNTDLKKHSYTELRTLHLTDTKLYMPLPRPQITAFDNLPFPNRSLVNYEKYNHYIGQAMVKNSVSLQATRGCPYNCTYCHNIWPKKHVVRSAENIFAEVQLYYNMGIRRFVFIDDTFNLNQKNSAEFFQQIIDSGLKIHMFFPNGLRGDILPKDYIDLMVKAGTVNLALALETASPRLQKLIKKNLNLEKLRETIDYFCKIYPHVILELFTMHGFPTETEEEAMMTSDFIKDLKWLHFPYVHILKIYPNTEMAKWAIDSGIPHGAINRSTNLAYHELPDTLPFDKSFTLKYQADFLSEYFLCKERLLHVLPHQMKIFTEDEIVQKYNSYLPIGINSFDDLLEFVGIAKDELVIEGRNDFLNEREVFVPYLNEKLKVHFSSKASQENALNVLLLDISQFFSNEKKMLYDVVEPPLGLMYLMSYLKQKFCSRVNGKIAKSRIDFDNYHELKIMLEDFQPDVIGVRSLTFYKDFFHQTMSMIRQWGVDVPIVAGGPYATSDYTTVLRDPNIDIVVLGEGEKTFCELIEKMMENEKKLPSENILKEIKGIAFIPYNESLQRNSAREIVMLDFLTDGVYGKGGENLQHINHPHDAAYVISTSGSTGKTKGVMIEHKNVVRLMINEKNLFDFDSGDVWTMFHSQCFDFSVWEMYGALVYGGKLIVIPKMISRNPEEFLGILKQEGVTVLNQTPSSFYNIVNEELKHRDKQLLLRYVIFGGEALAPTKLKDWRKKYPAIKLINMYGITETTVHVTYKEIGEKEIELNISNIGKPIPTLTTYVLGKNLKLLPLGVAGELCVGGEGVARGYLNRSDLSGEKFIKNPYKPNERLYKSGDIVRILRNGEMEYLGRMDRQLKIRGFRVELGEIENQLLKHRDIKEGLVIAQEDRQGDKYLCAYFISGKGLEASEVKDFISNNLPNYMIPHYFMQIDNIPLTPNGKVDRKALPMPESNVGSDYVLPRNELEAKLVEIWKKVLEIHTVINNVKNIGVRDNFFNIGGDSIKAIKLLSSINSQLNINLKIPDLYLNETIEKLANRIGQDQNNIFYINDELKESSAEIEALKNRIIEHNKVPPDIEDIYPMSDIQKGMVFHSLKDPGGAVYHDQILHQVKFPAFDPDLFKKSVALMVEKHPTLRTAFNIDDFEEPVQLIYKNVNLDIVNYDISNMEYHEQERFVKKIILEDRQQRFDSWKAPLWRMRTFVRDNDNVIFMWVFHHSIMDGWSDALFKTELNNIYFELKSNPGFVLGKLKGSYKDFIIEQNAEKKKPEMIVFWKNELKAYKRLEFPMSSEDDERFVGTRYHGFDLGIPLFEKLKEVAVRYNSSVKHLCFAAYFFMLSMLSYDNDIVAGLISNNRPVCEDGDKILACFLNTLPVRMKISTSIKWLDYIELVEKKMKKLKKYERLSLLEIIRILAEQTEDRNPIFDTIFNYVDFEIYNTMNRDRAEREVSDGVDEPLQVSGFADANTPFNFTVDATMGEFRLSISRSDSIMSDEMVYRLYGYFETILDKFIHEPEELIEKDKLISLEERQKLLFDFNSTEKLYPGDRTIDELFEEQVDRIPDNIALVGPSIGTGYKSSLVPAIDMQCISYKKLNEESTHLVGVLLARGFAPGNIVAIQLEKSIEVVISAMAVLKAGGAYLPIDPGYPAERIRYILEDSKMKILMTTRSLFKEFENLRSWEGEKIFLEEHFSVYERKRLACPAELEPLTSTSSQVDPTDLAYIIYTSGSTGRPKGVMIEHRGISNLKVFHKEDFEIVENDRIIQFASFSFDASVWETYMALLNGAALYILEEKITGNYDVFERYLETRGITVATLPPGYTNNLDSNKLKTLRMLITAGSAPPPGLANRWRKRVEYINAYGPTETTICAAVWHAGVSQKFQKVVPIGKPINNTYIYILDSNLNVQPIGITGELCISGVGVGRGYLNRPELTAEKFIDFTEQASPFPTPHSPTHLLNRSSLYRTGDLARWLPDGNIEFLGRFDYQVKIRGFRIELEEIENELLKCNEIKEAVVLAKEDEKGDQCLCAYIVPLFAGALNRVELKKHLAHSLPDYMIPVYFTEIEEIPLTPSGKVDRKALPALVIIVGSKYVAPRDEIERKLIGIWAEILGRDALDAAAVFSQLNQGERPSIGIDDNFFELGGHSLKATIMVSKLHKLLNVNIPLVEIFKAPTIRKLAEYIKSAKRVVYHREDENLVLINGTKNHHNHLFFIHDGSGDIESYIELCNYLKSEFNFWGIRADRVEHFAPRNFTIEEVAKKYLEKIKMIQPYAPYYIAGWSIGGIISFEMVRQLEQMNEEIVFFAIIDAHSPDSDRVTSTHSFTLESELEWLQRYFSDNEITRKLRKVTEINQLWEHVVNYLEANNFDVNIIKKIITQYEAFRVPPYQELSIGELIKYLNMGRTFHNAQELYNPIEKINTPIHYFRASQSKGTIKDNWNDFSIKPINFYEIIGDHFSIFSMPAIKECARIFDEKIQML